MGRPIYLDHHASTPVDPRVLEAMLPYFSEKFGNASSRHHIFGDEANEAVATAREQVASLIGAQKEEIIFTSGATESNNLALKGLASLNSNKKGIVTVATEHKAVLDVCASLEKQGAEITILPVNLDGRVSPETILKTITPSIAGVSVMAANNEIGAINPIEEIGKICKEKEVIFHCDAAQAVGKIPIDVEKMNIDLLSLSGHKMYGPKGVGAHFVRGHRPRIRLRAQIDGGGHERGMRSGTLNVPGIVGLGKACEIANKEMTEESERLTKLRNYLLNSLQKKIPDIDINGGIDHRLPGNLSIIIKGVDSEALLFKLKQEGIALSSGAACSTNKIEPSHVLKAIGLEEEVLYSALRFGLGRKSDREELDLIILQLEKYVNELREIHKQHQ